MMVNAGGKTGNSRWPVEVSEDYIPTRTRATRKCSPIYALRCAANFFAVSLRHPDSSPAELYNLHGVVLVIGKGSDLSDVGVHDYGGSYGQPKRALAS